MAALSRCSGFPVTTIGVLAACDDGGKIEFKVTECRDVHDPCEAVGTIGNSTEAEVGRVEFDLIAGSARSIHGPQSDIPAGGQGRFVVWFVVR